MCVRGFRDGKNDIMTGVGSNVIFTVNSTVSTKLQNNYTQTQRDKTSCMTLYATD